MEQSTQQGPNNLDPSKLSIIFSNLDMIINVGNDLRNQLEMLKYSGATNNNSSGSHSSNNSSNDTTDSNSSADTTTYNSLTNIYEIGEIFVRFSPTLQYTYSQYINNYGQAMKTLNWMQVNSVVFSNFLEGRKKHEVHGFLSLPAFLITPVQRVAQYGLLLRVCWCWGVGCGVV